MPVGRIYIHMYVHTWRLTLAASEQVCIAVGPETLQKEALQSRGKTCNRNRAQG
jgi:hypothetical protein